MSEVKKVDTHGNASGGNIKELSKFILWSITILFVIVFAVLIVIINPDTANMFIRFLQALQFLFFIVIIFCFYKLQDFRKRFLASCHEIDHIFADKNGQGHGHDHKHEDHHGHDDHEEKEKAPTNILEEKMQRAIGHINSQYKEEWKIGLVELDSILKALLIQKKYTGSTVVEMLSDAKEKGYKYSQDAIMAHKTKTHLLKNITKLPDENDRKVYSNILILYKKVIQELMH